MNSQKEKRWRRFCGNSSLSHPRTAAGSGWPTRYRRRFDSCFKRRLGRLEHWRPVYNHQRYIAPARVSRSRLFVWLDTVVLPDSKVIAITLSDDFSLGVLQSRIHEIWTLATCGWHGIG